MLVVSAYESLAAFNKGQPGISPSTLAAFVSASSKTLTPSAHELRSLLVSLEEDLRNDILGAGLQTIGGAHLSWFSALKALHLIPVKVIPSADASREYTQHLEATLSSSAQRHEAQGKLPLAGEGTGECEIDGNTSSPHKSAIGAGTLAHIARLKQDQ